MQNNGRSCQDQWTDQRCAAVAAVAAAVTAAVTAAAAAAALELPVFFS